MESDQPPSSQAEPDATTLKPSFLQRILLRFCQALTLKPRNNDQLVELMRETHATGVINAEMMGMLEGVLGVADSQVRDIMVPRSQMIVIERDATTKELLEIVVSSGHSRFPVIGESRDDIIGILMAKDVLRHAVDRQQRFDLREVLRPAAFIPESKRLNVLLWEFRSRRNHIAVVVDEYGGVAGLVTIEDVLEQIVGEIDDEHDVETVPNVVAHRNRRYSVRGLTELEEFNQYFGTDYAVDDMDTIGGYVTRQFGYVPKRGESTKIGHFTFTVLRADGRRILRLQVLNTEVEQSEAAVE